jgi:membrane-bound lytic murein transglycosylase C
MMNRILFTLFIGLLLTGCTTAEVQRTINLTRGLSNFENMSSAQQLRFVASQDATLAQYLDIEKLLERKLVEFIAEATKEWGEKPKRATKKKYVKYTQNYKSRAEVDFEKRVVTVETVDAEAPDKRLKEAIITTLLTPFDPTQVDLHSAKEIRLGEEPFLYKQVLDHDRKPIRWHWRAERYAKHLMKQGIKTRAIKTKQGTKRVRFVTFGMQKQALSVQAASYQDEVMKNAKRFGIHPALIYAVIEVESSFNPYATSHIPAYGLMQIVPKTAGRDTWKFLYGKDRIPTSKYLYDSKNNIEMGSAYLHIIDTRYLSNITNPRTREYCTVAAYNTGSGNVLRTFHKTDRSQAARIINGMKPEAVYDKLRSSLPYDETRRYIHKVREAKKRYL